MSKSLLFLFGAFTGVVLSIGFTFFSMPAPQNHRDPVGATPGTDHYSHEYFADTMTVGGRVLATSSVGAGTYTAGNLMNTSLIVHTAASAATATLPASSTLTSFIPRPGDSKTIYFQAVTTKVTLEGGSGTDLNTASSTKNVEPTGLGRLDFTRKANSDIEVLLTTGI